jgi:hypothetical protein
MYHLQSLLRYAKLAHVIAVIADKHYKRQSI